VTVVSGFAVGVDAAAHAGALERGATVAVLGCGHDVDYPAGHRELGARIARSGARVSEFPPGTSPSPWQFPVRNRLIAALGRACVVVEAAPRSGSLVTARLALELGREVLAVPGRVVDELALGVNALLADGARPVLDPRDVLEAIGMRAPAAQPAPEPRGLAADPLALWRAALAEPAACERLAERAGLPVARALVAALELELTGLVRRRPDGAYEAVRTAAPGARA
jgi:DNA processing protein